MLKSARISARESQEPDIFRTTTREVMITTDWLTTTTLASVAAFQDVKTRQASTVITAVMTLLSEMADGAIVSEDLSNPTCLPVKSNFHKYL